MTYVIGTCSECGGPVTLPSMMVHPVPRCQRCGATPAGPAHGPVIPMKPTARNLPSPYDLSQSPLARRGKK